VLPRGPRRGQVNFRSHNSCLPLGASSPGRRRACVLFGVSFRGGYSPTGLPGDTAWLAFPPTGRGRLGVLSHERPGAWTLVSNLVCRLAPSLETASDICGHRMSSRARRETGPFRVRPTPLLAMIGPELAHCCSALFERIYVFFVTTSSVLKRLSSEVF